MSKLAPEQGRQPTKLAFDGVEQGSPAAQLLYDQYGGAIRHFHAKARQQQIASGSPSHHAQGRLPGGGRITYSYNDGQEVIRVNVKPTILERVTRGETLRIDTPFEPLLAIDVLFTARSFRAGDVYSFEIVEGEPDTGAGDGVWYDQSKWVKRYQSGIGAAFFDLYGGGHASPGLYWVYGEYTATTAQGIMIGAAENGGVEFFDINDTAQTPKSAYVSFGAIAANTRDFITETLWFIPLVGGGTGGPGDVGTDEEQHNERETRELHNVLAVVGAVGNPEPPSPSDPPYEARSTGERDSNKLVPCTELQASRQITRELVMSDAPPPNFVGAGFLARPTVPTPPGFPPTPTVIDIYLASSNTRKFNEFPGAEGATFAADDPTFDYEADRGLTFQIRVREFVDQSPLVVQVTTTTQLERQEYTAPEPTAVSEPTIAGPLQRGPADPPRTVVWAFAAGSNWADTGNEPADPRAVDAQDRSTMGTLLAETEELSVEVVGPEPVERRVYSEAEWVGAVTAMTKVARITWTPPERVYEDGAATIEPT